MKDDSLVASVKTYFHELCLRNAARWNKMKDDSFVASVVNLLLWALLTKCHPVEQDERRQLLGFSYKPTFMSSACAMPPGGTRWKTTASWLPFFATSCPSWKICSLFTLKQGWKSLMFCKLLNKVPNKNALQVFTGCFIFKTLIWIFELFTSVSCHFLTAFKLVEMRSPRLSRLLIAPTIFTRTVVFRWNIFWKKNHLF